jgi:membrane protein required for colicin V production
MPSYLDLGVLAIILVSALLAMLRGFTREVLAIASWIAAAAAGIYLSPYLVPYVKPYISKDPWATIASATAIFFVALILVSIITVNLSDAVLDSRVGALDRSLGFLFGAARGFILCVIAFVFFTLLVDPAKQPAWLKNARTRPLLQGVGDDMQAMLPHDLLNKIIKSKSSPAEEPAGEGETPSEKSDVEQDSPAPLPPPRDAGGKGP